MKISEEKALEEYPIDIIPDNDTMGFTSSDRNEVIRLGYIQGYDQAMQDFLEKARTWFFSDLYKYLVNSKEISIDEISRHFKNYMQNESEK